MGTRLAWFVMVRRHLKFVKSFKKLVKSTCPQNPTIKRRRKPRPLAGPPKRQSSKKKLEKRRKCRLREQQKGKRSPEPGKSFEHHIPTKFIHQVTFPYLRCEVDFRFRNMVLRSKNFLN